MPDCDYCDSSFQDEDAYLDHLDRIHEGELSTIDQRRVDERRSDGGTTSNLLTYGGIALVILVLGGVLIWGVAGLGGNEGGSPAPTNPDDPLLSDVQSFESEGNTHVAPGTEIDYGTSPPTSGNHYQSSARAGFYSERPAFGNLVHSLEHGAIIIYYDPANLSESAEEDLRSLTQQYTGPWQSVLAVPHVEENPEHPYVLTAWRHLLRMDSYDEETVRAFLDAYRGRGPENPVR
jgi:hypothetical protein